MGILSGRGAYEGSKKEKKGYEDAKMHYFELKDDIEDAHKMIDPWNKYRAGYGDQLNRILQGEEDFTADPGYQFRVDEDTRATERAAAARGGNISGNVLAELGNRRQQMASQEYGNIINRLVGLSAATPENAIAGGQFYGQAMMQRAQGMAEADIGIGFARSRGIAAGHTGIEDTAYSLMNYFIPGGNFGSGDKGTGGGMPWGQQPAGGGGTSTMSFGDTGGGGMGETNFGTGGGSMPAMGESFGGMSSVGGMF